MSVSASAVVFLALCFFCTNGFAFHTLAVHRSGARASHSQGRMDNEHRLDLVMVQPQGWQPNGFRYRIVLDSTTRGEESALDLTADEGGLRVIARDVDGIGKDLDLIIEGACSLAPVGIWINNHHGGFTMVDSSYYSASIWDEASSISKPSVIPPDNFQASCLPSFQSCASPGTRPCPFEQLPDKDLARPSNLDGVSRLAADPQQTRGPPFRS